MAHQCAFTRTFPHPRTFSEQHAKRLSDRKYGQLQNIISRLPVIALGCLIMHASLLKPDVQPNRQNTMWRLRLLSIHSTGIVNASAVFQPLIGSRVRHLRLMKSPPRKFLTNKSVCKDKMISHHSDMFSRSNSWRHYLSPNASVKSERWIKQTVYSPRRLASKKRALKEGVGPVVESAAQ